VNVRSDQPYRHHQPSISDAREILRSGVRAEIFSFRIIDAPIYADGYVGMQIIPRATAMSAASIHFGMVVDDVETVLERMQKKHRKPTS